MMNTTLQLMANAPGIGRADVAADTPGVRITDIVRPGSPNYLIVYLDISAATPGRVSLRITLDGTERTVEYELRPRRADLGSLGRLSCADVVYLLLPDRFAQGRTGNGSVGGMMPYRTDRSEPSLRHGGDLEGIRRHLEYFTELGVTALWLTPVLENNSPDSGLTSSYHGYAITDFYRTDPRLGTNDDYRRLVAEAHQMGLKVVMDMVFNHCGIWHPWLRDLPSADWINRPERPAAANDGWQGAKYLQTNYRLTPTVDPYAAEADLRETTEGWFVPSMPDLNQSNPHVMKYLIQNSIWWIEYSKIDGIRMDTYPYADMEPMAQWIKDVQLEYPGYNIVGECWYGDVAGTAYWQGGNRLNAKGNPELPTVMDFPTMLMANSAFHGDTQQYGKGLNEIYNRLSLDYVYADPQKVLTFLDNHDTDRFLLTKPTDLGSWKQGMAFLLTTRGIPQIYYGTELLMFGDKKRSDGDIRLDVPGGFPGDSRNEFTAAGRSELQNEAFDFLSRLAQWRRGNDVIAHGSLKHFMPENGMYVYERSLNGKRVIVIMNGTDRTLDIDMSIYSEIMQPGIALHDVLTGEEITILPNMQFAPRALYILE